MLRHFVDARLPGAGGRGLRPGRTVRPRIACEQIVPGRLPMSGRFAS